MFTIRNNPEELELVIRRKLTSALGPALFVYLVLSNDVIKSIKELGKNKLRS